MTNDRCRWWDCGWCFHPTEERNNGCIGYSQCDVYEDQNGNGNDAKVTGHSLKTAEFMSMDERKRQSKEKMKEATGECYASNKGGGSGTREPFITENKPKTAAEISLSYDRGMEKVCNEMRDIIDRTRSELFDRCMTCKYRELEYIMYKQGASEASNKATTGEHDNVQV